MTAVTRAWGRLTIPGRVVLALLVLGALLMAALVVLLMFADPILTILANNLPVVRFVVAVTVILLMTIPTAFLIIYMEMKVIALMNLRIGPDRVGPAGL